MKVNLQTGNFQRRPVERSDRSVWGRLWLVVQLMLLLVVVVAICNAYVYLNQQIALTASAIRTSRYNIHLADREIDSLRIQRERLSSWPHISNQIRKYNLGLRAPAPGQVRKLVLRLPVRSDAPRVARR